MFIINICVTKNAGHRYLTSESNCRKGQPSYVHANLTFYSSFEENCREIVNYSLPPRRKPPQKNFNTERKMSTENCPRLTPAPKELSPWNKANLQEIYVAYMIG